MSIHSFQKFLFLSFSVLQYDSMYPCGQMRFIQRRINVDASMLMRRCINARRCIDINATFFKKCHDVASSLTRRGKTSWGCIVFFFFFFFFFLKCKKKKKKEKKIYFDTSIKTALIIALSFGFGTKSAFRYLISQRMRTYILMHYKY